MPARPEAGDEEMEGILYLLQEFKGKVVLFGISDVRSWPFLSIR